MAKKGQSQSFQYEINTDEDLTKYLTDRKGLVVIDIYTDWCGPCVGMLNNLKKIKLELGGDNLHLAVAKSDTIEVFSRFRNKSEPTWMFVVNGRATALLFGANVPALTKLVTKELETLNQQKANRKTYALDELHPQEVEKAEEKRLKDEENNRLERDAEDYKRRVYLDFCTNTIMENMPETGIMIFGPHINRDCFKKILEVAEKYKVQPKDRKLIVLDAPQCQTLFYACDNPIEQQALDYIFGKEIAIIMWKLAEGKEGPIEELLFGLCEALSKPYENENDSDEMLPALFPPLELKVIDTEAPKINENEGKKKADKKKVEEEQKEEEVEKADENAIEIETQENVEEEKEKTKEKEPKESVEKKEIILPMKTIYIPSAWTPGNKRTNAAGIYLFFRQQTLPFLPPDPIPEPPHVVVIYDAWKKKEISDLITQWNEDVLAYGYFQLENYEDPNPDEAQLVANSTKKYDELENKTPTDRIILKIAKTTSHCLLDFAAANPCYVSENCVSGEQEALRFFPKGYKTGEQEEAEAILKAQEAAFSKKKKKKTLRIEIPEGEQPPENPAAATEEAEAEEAEQAETPSPEQESPQ